MLTKKWYSKAFKKFKNVSSVLAYGHHLQEIFTLGRSLPLEWRKVKDLNGWNLPFANKFSYTRDSQSWFIFDAFLLVSIHLWP